MENIIIRNKKYEKRFRTILDEHRHRISQEDLNFIKIVILRFKKNSNNEYFIILTLIYGLIYFKAMDRNDYKITSEDSRYLDSIYESYFADINGDYEKYIQMMMEMEHDLFVLKTVIKYTLLNSPNYLERVIPNIENYYKSIGYLIPLLTLKESSFLLFYQDAYFRNLYPEEYSAIKSQHLAQTSKLELPWEYIISSVNSISYMLAKAGVEGILKMRKKSYFSLYSKYKRKPSLEVTDTLGMRIIFRDLKSLYKFINVFEADFVYLKKKDFVKHPKENGYKSIHYSFINPFRNSEILIELQLRTKKMDKDIHDNALISHFNYTIFQHKWDDLFVEVHAGYKVMDDYIQKVHPDLYKSYTW